MKWGLKLVELATLSDLRYKEAQEQLKIQNAYAYHERLNPGVKTGIGKIRENRNFLLFLMYGQKFSAGRGQFCTTTQLI